MGGRAQVPGPFEAETLDECERCQVESGPESAFECASAGSDRTSSSGDIEGFVKAMIDGKGRILGAAIVGHGAGELIAPWSLAISQGLKIGAMIEMVAPYPARTEASRRAALQALMPKLRNPWLSRIVRWARALG